jgi:hypothetical protein
MCERVFTTDLERIIGMGRQPAPRHGVSGYRRGCRCAACSSAERLRQLHYRTGTTKGTPTPKPDTNVVALPTAKHPVQAGAVEAAVAAECAKLSTAVERPADVQQALVLARILDDAEVTALHPVTSRQLHALMESLRTGRKLKSKGRLAAIQAITTRRETP